MKFSKKRLREIITEEISKSDSEQPLHEGLSERDIYSLYYDIRDGSLKLAEFKSFIQKLLNSQTDIGSSDEHHFQDPVAFAQSREE